MRQPFLTTVSGTHRLLTALVISLTFSLHTVADDLSPRWFWKQTAAIPAAEAHQAAAADAQFLYAISSTQVAKYSRETGERIAVSSGPAKHLNSGFFFNGRLYCAHSNYPQTPEQSSLMVLDPESMHLTTFKDFGNAGGSLTWAIRQDDRWWCNFAKYGDSNAETFLVEYDDQWHEQSRWTWPPEVIGKLGRYSLSGGVWRGRLLLVTGHDDPVIFRLRLPESGRVLEYVDQQPAPFTGQGIAVDPVTHGLIGIHCAKKQMLLARLEAPHPEPRLPRDQLLLVRDAADTKATRPINAAADWPQRRKEIVSSMQIVMGSLPGREKRCPLDVRIEEEIDRGTYLIRLVTYESEPGSRVPAYLCVPKAALQPEAAPVPAVLCLHGTDNVTGSGTVVGIGGRPNRQYASELAERGYVTLAPNYPLLARYQPDVLALGWESGTLKAVWDNMRGLDLLESLPYVKRAADGSSAFGAIGHSLGGHNAVYTSVFDARIKAVVSSCGLDSYLDYYGGEEKVWLPEKGWTQTRYMPRLREYRGRLADIPFDFHEMLGALAPRHVLISAPLHDSNFKADSVDRVAAAAREVYQLHGHPERLRIEHPDCDHDFPPALREAAYRLFDEVLR